MSATDLSIIIVNYNGGKFLAECLDSIFSSTTTYTYEVIVVDNCSTDDSISVLEEFEDRIKLIKSDINGGFSYGNNRGAEKATGRYIFMLNNDTVVPKELFETMLNYYEENPDIGALAPKLLNSDGSLQRQGSVLSQSQYKTEAAKTVSFVTGAAVMTTREIWNELDGMDENFFFYNEDIDFCKRIRNLGKKIVFYPKAQLLHYGGLSTQFRRKGSIIEGYRGGLYLVKKHYAYPIYFLYRFALLFDVVPRLTFSSVAALFDARYRENMAAYFEVLKINLTGQILREV